MDDLSIEGRLASLIDAVKKAAPTDASLGFDRSGGADGLDRLADQIDDLLRRFQDFLKACQGAQETLGKLQLPGDEEGEELSREHRLLLHALKENVPDTIYFKDLQGRITHLVSARVKAFDLVSREDAVGKTDFDLFTEEHARSAFEDEQKIIHTGQPILNKEEKETWPDRSTTWVLTTKMPLRDAEGRIVGTFGISRSITERKRAEERYQMLFNSIDDAVLVHGIGSKGRPGRIMELNDIACERLGYPRDELLRMNPLDLLPPETAATAVEMMVGLAREKHAVWEGVLASRTGLRTPVEISSHLFDISGEPMVLSTFRDITRRKQLEESLESEKALLLTLIDNLPDHVSVKDVESRFLITNTSNARVMGLERPQDAVGKTDFDFYPEAEAARYVADEQTVMRTGLPLINKEEESTDPDGSARWTLTSKVALRNARGEVIGVVCTGRDITERKQADERIHDLARFTDESPHPIMRVSPEGEVLFANPASRALLGSWAGGVPSDARPEILLAWEWDERRKIETRDGENVIELTVTPIRSRGYINLYGRDVTEEKSLGEKFLQAQKMEAVGRLAGGIAHDFNNLLTVIGGYCDLARQELVPDSPVRERIDEIAKAARQAAGLTRKLLAFSRKQVLMPQVINLNDLLRTTESMVARLVGEDVELRLVLDPAAGNIRADPGQIEQVIMNLVVNARDAMPEGGTLTIETSNRSLGDDDAPGARPGDYVQIAVSDTGHGMDREVLSHIFEPFFTTKDISKGTGLGLSTVYGIVEQSSGHISCASEPGKGTRFTILFPRTAEANVHAAAPLEDNPAFRGSETILLVEDEAMVRHMTRTLLENTGYRVIEASGGPEALAATERNTGGIDLVVTDVVMPHMNGKELARRLTLLNPLLKVLFLSGYTPHQGTPDPGVDFLRKPFTARELLSKIREILNRAGNQRA